MVTYVRSSQELRKVEKELQKERALHNAATYTLRLQVQELQRELYEALATEARQGLRMAGAELL